VNQRQIAAGNQALMAQAGAEIPAALAAQAVLAQKDGKTVSYIAVDRSVSGLVIISDPVKAGSRDAVKHLMRLGIEVIMLTGDNEHTAATVAGELQLTGFKAGQLPEDKLREIKRLQSTGKIVAMAGDGINDAPTLAQADVGIAMGAGTDVAIESAKITLLKGDLRSILQAKNLSHAVMKNIRQNLFFAFVYNALGVPLAAGVLYPFFGILLSPMTAALAMSLSSVSVILNALRLKNSKI
jgi:Cu+-exporting ATPase